MNPIIIPNVSKAGRLVNYISEWKLICKDKFVLDIVNGFTIPFHTEPTQVTEPKECNLTNAETELVEKAVKSLLLSGAIVNSIDEEDQFISSVFPVPKSNGSARLVINLKHLNKFVECPHFKMEDCMYFNSV